MPEISTKLKLPGIRTVKLRRFSLFDANPDAEFACPEGVLCLIGANGIGKSTLLSAINYGLTGIVSDPTRAFESIGEFYKFTRGYSTSYFRGRILGGDEEDAEIALVFSIGDFQYDIRRGLFEPDELRGLTIKNGAGELLLDSEGMPRRERHTAYAASLVQHTGLTSFEEFVFLQHFVFTFDEQRKTLFWSPRVMERVLYRAFGLDPNMAKQADAIRREIQHEDSKVRNYQWEATRMRKRINEIRAKASSVLGAQQQFDSLVANHEDLTRQFDADTKALREAENALRDANIRLAEQSVRETALRDEYAQFFDRHFKRRPPLARHPWIVQSLEAKTCALCGSPTPASQKVIAERCTAETCPLCDAPVHAMSLPNQDTARLQEIDKELQKLRVAILNSRKAVELLQAADAHARKTWEDTKEKVERFERENTSTLDSLRNLLSHGAPDTSLKDYRDQLVILDHDKRVAYTRRESLKSDLARLQRKLEQQYLQVEQQFVPQFASLAQHFLGMPLSVEMDARASDDVKLVVTVRGTTRRLQHHLSESQRFFLDIALRMALTQHMSDQCSPGGMYIDTPEGSLDIAYEKRAGDMLAMFASAGHPVIMTANLNSSQLLLALARRCGHAGMALCRMTDWAELSEVQQEEEALFEEAYRQIERAMGDSGEASPAPLSRAGQ